MNIRQRCAKCGVELVKGKRTLVLMQGPRGFRKYDVCLRCAGVGAPSKRTVYKLALEERKATPHLQKPKMGGVRKGGV
jgi:hypothetical protein